MNISASMPPEIASQTSVFYCACHMCAGAADSSGKTLEKQLTDEERKEVQELRQRDSEVRAHEQAHVAAGGACVQGGAHYEFQTGPDGKRYAVGGEVSIDTSEVADNPQATIQKMQIVRKAALAPASPSGQDRAVAAAASQNETAARQELRQEKSEEGGKNSAVSRGENEDVNRAGTAGYSRHGISISRPRNCPPVLDLIA